MIRKLITVAALCLAASAAVAQDKMLFDFEDAATLSDWKALESSAISKEEPAAKVEFVAEQATSGKSSLKITFAGGKMPGIATAAIPLPDWKPPLASFLADVTADRDCIAIFRAITETYEGKDGDARLYVKVARLQKGPNKVSDSLFPPKYGGYFCLGPKTGKIVSFEIRLYQPAKDQVLYVDNIRLSSEQVEATPFFQLHVDDLGGKLATYKSAAVLDRKIKVLGGKDEYASVVEMAKANADKWVEPKERTIQEVEADFAKRLDAFKADHPSARLAILRDGQKGLDASAPEKAFDGWRDAYIGVPQPGNAMFGALAQPGGKGTTIEFAFRSRCPLMQCDLSAIPKGSKVLAAEFVATRIVKPDREKLKGPWAINSPYKPTFWVFEPCNRPWVEAEMNIAQYADGKYWKNAGGMHWAGDDPDFLPLVIASGQSGATVCTWDFTRAVEWWVGGKQPNYGFAFYPVTGYLDFGRFYSRENKNPLIRPLLMVIYAPPTAASAPATPPAAADRGR